VEGIFKKNGREKKLKFSQNLKGIYHLQDLSVCWKIMGTFMGLQVAMI
jgi:hypothetical protein